MNSGIGFDVATPGSGIEIGTEEGQVTLTGQTLDKTGIALSLCCWAQVMLDMSERP